MRVYNIPCSRAISSLSEQYNNDDVSSSLKKYITAEEMIHMKHFVLQETSVYFSRF